MIAVFCARVLAGRAPVIYGDGTQTRDYVYVGDVVRAFVAAADTGRAGTWNIGTGIETSVLELINVIAQIAGRTVPPELAPARAGELLRSAVASGLAGRDLGWQPLIPRTDGIRKVYRWIGAGAPVRAES